MNRESVYDEVLAHFNGCAHRSSLINAEQVAGLAQHITSIIADREQQRMRNAG